MQTRREGLAAHVADFARALRRAGIPVGTGQLMDALRAVELVGVTRRNDVYQALFALFVRHPRHRELFDALFEAFWRAPSELRAMMNGLLPKAGEAAAPRQRVQEALQEPDEAPEATRAQPEPPEEEGEEVTLVATYSAAEVLRQKDFADFSAAEVEQAKAVLARMRWPFAPQRVRRRQPDPAGRLLDMRRTMRSALRHHGEVLRLHRQGPREKRRPVVVLCDVSGSMEPYARMLLHFMHAVTGDGGRVESFVFGTRLTRITRSLRRRDVDEALADVAQHVQDWAGGTRIGEALRTFNVDWLRRTLRSGGVVLLISDGCDRGDPAVLAHEMARLQRSCSRLVWLNPLLRYDAYEPRTRGMEAALPHVDDFLPVHNLASLEQLGAALGRLTARHRPTWQAMYGWAR